MKGEVYFYAVNIETIFFHHTLVESATFAPGYETRMWYFRPGYGEKQYSLHWSKIAQPTSRVCHRSDGNLYKIWIVDNNHKILIHMNSIPKIVPCLLIQKGCEFYISCRYDIQIIFNSLFLNTRLSIQLPTILLLIARTSAST